MSRFENDDYDTWAAQKYDEAVESWCLMADEAHERIGADRVGIDIHINWDTRAYLQSPLIQYAWLWILRAADVSNLAK
jgi:hypothetical protein